MKYHTDGESHLRVTHYIYGDMMLNTIEKFKVKILHMNRDWNHWSLNTVSVKPFCLIWEHFLSCVLPEITLGQCNHGNTAWNHRWTEVAWWAKTFKKNTFFWLTDVQCGEDELVDNARFHKAAWTPSGLGLDAAGKMHYFMVDKCMPKYFHKKAFCLWLSVYDFMNGGRYSINPQQYSICKNVITNRQSFSRLLYMN